MSRQVMLSDEVYRRIKSRAAVEGTSMAGIIERMERKTTVSTRKDRIREHVQKIRDLAGMDDASKEMWEIFRVMWIKSDEKKVLRQTVSKLRVMLKTI